MHLDQWTIEGEMTISWTITKFGRSAHRVIWDGSLALSRTSYKGLGQRGIHPNSGAHHLFLKEDKVSLKTSQFCIGNNLFAPDLLFFLMDFSQV